MTTHTAEAIIEKKPERRNDWRTPPEIFKALNEEYGPFTLDAAASAENTLCPQYFDESTNGLTSSWAGHVVWCNPPYNDPLSWVVKATRELHENGVISVLLLPASVDTGWFHVGLRHAQIELFRGRIRFIDPTGNNRDHPKQPNCLMVFHPRALLRGVVRTRDAKTGNILRQWP